MCFQREAVPFGVGKINAVHYRFMVILSVPAFRLHSKCKKSRRFYTLSSRPAPPPPTLSNPASSSWTSWPRAEWTGRIKNGLERSQASRAGELVWKAPQSILPLPDFLSIKLHRLGRRYLPALRLLSLVLDPRGILLSPLHRVSELPQN